MNPPSVCLICGRDPAKVNSRIAQCSHVDCPCRGPVLASWPLPVVDEEIGAFELNLLDDPEEILP